MKKILCMLLSLIFVVISVVPVFAQNSDVEFSDSAKSGLTFDVKTDKSSYNSLGIAKIDVSIKNESSKDIKNVSAEAVFSDLAPVRGGSTFAKTDVLKAGESLSFSYMVTINKNNFKLNSFQKLFLWIIRFFNGGYNAVSNGFDDGRDGIVQTNNIEFGNFTAQNKIRVWFGEKIVYVNDFMKKTDEIELFTASCRGEKMDGFVFKYNKNVVLLDGGLAGTDEGSVYDYLYSLREKLLPDGVDVREESYKLKIDIVISHFHNDHVRTLLVDIIPSPYFDVNNVYLSEKSDFENTTLYSDTSLCAPDSFVDVGTDKKGRKAFLNELEQYSLKSRVKYVPFGDTMSFFSDDGNVKFELFAASQDWGTQENAEKFLRMYQNRINEGDLQKYSTMLANANSMWLKVTYKNVKMLFTGDVMKRQSFAYTADDPDYLGEPFDLMLSYYGEKCGSDVFDVDILKFPHHGTLRAEASKGVFEVMKPSIIICTAATYLETTIANAAEYWENYTGEYYLAEGLGLYITTDGTTINVH